jgi:hypothetical protein
VARTLIVAGLFALLVLGTGDAAAPDAAPGSERPGIWLSHAQIRELPISGQAWLRLERAAAEPAGHANVSDQDSDHDVLTLAKALVYARTGEARYRTEVRHACESAIGTDMGGRTLALGRNLASYVIAADLVGLPAEEDDKFKSWLKRALTRELEGKTLKSTQEIRPNNWGAHASASRAAVAAYLGDREELERTALVFKGWLGDRDSWSSFEYGDRSWQADPERPVGINPQGAERKGQNVDGLVPDDMRRGGPFAFPPVKTDYPWGSIGGAAVCAEILSRQDYDAWNWEDRALLRATDAMYRLSQRYPRDGWWADEDDAWVVWLVNHVYGSDFPTAPAARPGKNMGWTDWTHAGTRAAPDTTATGSTGT